MSGFSNQGRLLWLLVASPLAASRRLHAARAAFCWARVGTGPAPRRARGGRKVACHAPAATDGGTWSTGEACCGNAAQRPSGEPCSRGAPCQPAAAVGGTQGWGQSQTLAAWGPTMVTAQPRVGFTASAVAVHGWRRKAWCASSQSELSRPHQEGDTLPSASSASLWLLTAAPGSQPLFSRKN